MIYKRQKRENPAIGWVLNWRSAMSYSHMGRPHTTIGATTFHF